MHDKNEENTQGISIGQQDYHVTGPAYHVTNALHCPENSNKFEDGCEISTGQWEMKPFPEIYGKVYLIPPQIWSQQFIESAHRI